MNQISKMPIAKEGFPFILFFLTAAFLVSFIPHFFFKVLSVVFVVLALFTLYFFRDPERNKISDPSVILAPGDGRILEVSEVDSPYWEGKAKVIKIFLSIFDVHIQRSPISGKVTKIEYKEGKFLDARHPKASLENEQNSIFIQNDHTQVVVKQIAGLIARRIACWVKTGDHVDAGKRIGLIRFGSQVDLLVPNEVECCVSQGDRVEGGLSVIAVRKNMVSKEKK